MFAITRRRRNVLLACGAVAAGGYVTYRVYQSRKRIRVFLFFESFSTLLEVLAAGSDSFALVLADLRSFLVSEADEVPPSLKQLMKLARSPEAQESISAVTAAVSRGLLAAFSDGAPPRRLPSPSFEEADVIKDIHCLEGGASSSVDVRALFMTEQFYDRECDGELDVDNSSEGDVHSGKRDMVDKLADKLFSESGKGFASAVVASASRSVVTSLVEHMNSPSEVDSKGGALKELTAFAKSDDGKAVLTDWIQTFVGTAVAVYLDRTKDINTFDELAVTLENPEHRGAITDLVSTVCETSTSTFVRTSHEVLTSSKQDSEDTEDSEVFYDMGEQEPISPSQSPIKWKGKTIIGRSEPAAPTNYIEQISNVLAVPSNRKLILDIAGTMTSTAVRSTIDVSLGKVSAALGVRPAASKAEEAAVPRTRTGVGEKLQAVGDVTKAAMDKSVGLMTMCFAVCLHSVVGGVRMVQPF